MALPFWNQSPPSAFNLELSGYRGDHHDQYHHLFNLEEPRDHQTSFSSSSLSSPMFFTPPPDHDQPQPPSQYREQPQKFQFQLLEGDKIGSYGGSCDDQTLENEGGGNGSTVLKLSISKNGAPRNGGDAMNNNSSSVKWMSSKMRIMRKMTNPDQSSSSCPTATTNTISSDEKPFSMSRKMSSSSNNTNTAPITRVCSDCNTTKTPLWRSGPRGPKSLCNACGIRQRKARRAMAAAAAVANGTTLAAAAAAGGAMKINTSAGKVVQHKENKSRVGSSTVPFKKRPYKLASSSTSPSPRGNKSANKKLCTFEDFAITMNTNSSSDGGGGGTTTTTTSTTATTTTTTTTTALHQRVFPQDEKEAAILLMALSYGLVHG